MVYTTGFFFFLSQITGVVILVLPCISLELRDGVICTADAVKFFLSDYNGYYFQSLRGANKKKKTRGACNASLANSTVTKTMTIPAPLARIGLLLEQIGGRGS